MSNGKPLGGESEDEIPPDDTSQGPSDPAASQFGTDRKTNKCEQTQSPGELPIKPEPFPSSGDSALSNGLNDGVKSPTENNPPPASRFDCSEVKNNHHTVGDEKPERLRQKLFRSDQP